MKTQMSDFQTKDIKKLNLGCGNKIKKGWTNVDWKEGEGIDKSFDFEKFPYPFKDNTFDFILMQYVFEHMKEIYPVIKELRRICKPNAIVSIFVAYWSASQSFNDPTHWHYFNKRCFEVTFSNKEHWKILDINLISGKRRRIIPRFIRDILDRFLTSMFETIHTRVRVLK